MKNILNSLFQKLFYPVLVGALLFSAATSSAATNTVNQVLTGTNTWYKTNIYVLNGAVFVLSNALLNIEAGTVIKGTNTGSSGTNVGALYITQGGKINAQGTADAPIIFTTTADDTTDPTDMYIWGSQARGLWGGVIIMGSATINSATSVSGNAATPKYEIYEGLADLQLNGQYVFRFGGTNDNDNSGVFRYVSIRHGGAVLAPNKEINGLSLCAVGRGTTVEYVEAFNAADDGFEFFGGTVNTRYLVSSFNDDDSFDTDMGYSGTNQFWFSIQAPDKRNYGMELNSQLNELIGPGPTNQMLLPQGTFTVYNLTVLGSGVNNTVNSGGNNFGIALRPYASPRIYNAIFSDFNGRQGILLDTQNGLTATNCWTDGLAQIKNTLWWNFSNVGLAGSAATNNTAVGLGNSTLATNWFTTASFTNQIADPLFVSISRTNTGGLYLDPRPAAGSPAYSNFAPTPAGLAPASYRGAFGSNNLWIAKWTALSQYEILKNQPLLASYKNGGNFRVSYETQPGFNYQLQSKTNLVTQTAWANVGSPVAGDGFPVTNTVPVSGAAMFFRVEVQ